MGAPRLPVAKADITGAVAKNPGRHANREDLSTVPLGKPSTFLDEHGAAWEGLKRELPG